MNTIVKTTTFNGKTSRGHKDILRFLMPGKPVWLSSLGFEIWSHPSPCSHTRGGQLQFAWQDFLEFGIYFCSLSLPADFYHWCPLSAQTWYKSHDPFLLLTLHLMPANSQQNRYLTRPAVHDPLVLDGHHVSGLHLQSDVVLLRVH